VIIIDVPLFRKIAIEEKEINTSKKNKNLKYKFGVSKGESPLVVLLEGVGV